MISNQQVKIYASLKLKKFRKEYGLFLVEGIKSIQELLQSDYRLERLICDEESFAKSSLLRSHGAEIVSAKILSRISNMKTASGAIAVCKIPKEQEGKPQARSVLIEDIQDPGNLGTIIRTAHWFGFNQVVCSSNSVDCYNPKVIQASMGSVFKLSVIYTDLKSFIAQMQSQNLRVLGTFMQGESIYQFPFDKNDSFLLGNEGQGISDQLKDVVDAPVSIPNFSKGIPTESLNIANAASVFCSEMTRGFL